MKKINKVAKYIAGIILGLIVIAIGVDYGLKKYYSKQDSISAKQQIEGSRYLYSALECVEKLQSDGIQIDSDYLEVLQNGSKNILENYTTEYLSIMTLVQMMYIDNCYNKDKLTELNELLSQFYDKENYLFSELPYEEYNEEIIKEQQKIWVSLSVASASILDCIGNYTSDYKIREGLANWYNKNIDSVNGLDGEEKEYYIDNLVAIFWYMQESDNLSLIEYEKIQPYIEEDIEIAKKLIDNDEYEDTMTIVLSMDEVSSYEELFYNDDTYSGLSSICFNKIDSLSKLEYDKEDEYFVNFLCEMLCTVDDCSENTFFADTINNCLKENYVNCYEETFSSK